MQAKAHLDVDADAVIGNKEFVCVQHGTIGLLADGLGQLTHINLSNKQMSKHEIGSRATNK